MDVVCSTNGNAGAIDPLINMRNELAQIFSCPFCGVKPQALVSSVVSWGRGSAPQYLYRYRTANDYSMRELEREEACFTSASEFVDMDQFDCSLYFPNDREAEEKLSKRIDDMVAILADGYFTESCASLFSRFGIDVAAGVEGVTLEDLYWSNDQLQFSGRLRKAQILGFIERAAPNVERELKCRKIMCLTPRIDNEHMWREFADSSRGFVLEYESANLHLIDSVCQRMPVSLPVVYGEQDRLAMMAFVALFGIDNSFARLEMDAFRMLLLLRSVYTKSPRYSDEEEWRLMLPVKAGEREEKHIARYCPVHAIILGCNMSDENRDAISRIAQSHGIQVRNQKIQ